MSNDATDTRPVDSQWLEENTDWHESRVGFSADTPMQSYFLVRWEKETGCVVLEDDSQYPEPSEYITLFRGGTTIQQLRCLCEALGVTLEKRKADEDGPENLDNG